MSKVRKAKARARPKQLTLGGVLTVTRSDPGIRWARSAELELLCGVDEVGRGPLAGPVVAGAVVVSVGQRFPKVADSKILTHEQRAELLAPIRAAALGHAVAACSVEEIDTLGILPASLLAMHRAVTAAVAMAGGQSCLVVVDGRECIPNWRGLQRPLVDGDATCAAVAAASILAKEHRDEMLRTLDVELPAYGFARHKGYATAEHLAALRAHGPTVHHRRSFEPLKSYLVTGTWPAHAPDENVEHAAL
ncbi:MAG: ribonuclease HII [Myxococcota bacterium]